MKNKTILKSHDFGFYYRRQIEYSIDVHYLSITDPFHCKVAYFRLQI